MQSNGKQEPAFSNTGNSYWEKLELASPMPDLFGLGGIAFPPTEPRGPDHHLSQPLISLRRQPKVQISVTITFGRLKSWLLYVLVNTTIQWLYSCLLWGRKSNENKITIGVVVQSTSQGRGPGPQGQKARTTQI
jgi:hypothetical protein